MILARTIAAASPGELDLAFDRMALPRGARDYLLEKLPFLHVLLTGLGKEEGRFLRGCAEGGEAPGREEFPAFAPGDGRHRAGTALLSGRREQFERLLRAARDAKEQAALVLALERALGAGHPPAPLTLGERTFAFGQRLYLMGVVNVTPDSFSDGGRFFNEVEAVAQGTALERAGADLLDVGGESTRPGAPEVSVREELRRVVPVIRALRERTRLPISVDTRKAEVARAACEAGASLVNDISGFRHDKDLPRAAAEAGAALCAMHIRGTPETMQVDPRYDDAVEEILAFLEGSVDAAVGAGVPRARVMVDPGLGFGKTFGHNHFLLRRLADFRLLGLPVLVGPSRKAFLGALVGGKPAPERVLATAACAAFVAAGGGADFIRVHDAAEVRDAVTVAEALRHAREGGALWSG
jgi:dihydropteroate synthase